MEGKQAPRRTSSGGGNSRQSGEELAAKSGRRAPSTQRRPGAAGSRQQHGEAAAGAGCGPRQRDVIGAHREHRRWDGGRDTPRIIIAGMAMGTYRESSSLGWRRGHRIRKEQSPQDGGRGTPNIIIAGMAMCRSPRWVRRLLARASAPPRGAAGAGECEPHARKRMRENSSNI